MLDEQDSARFWSYVDKNGTNGCWEWTSSLYPQGYGRFWLYPRNLRAHRISYTITKGPIPQGLVLDHLCRNRKCVNPDHLEAVTNRQNTLRGISGIKAAAPPANKEFFCVQGHERTPENTYRRSNGVQECRKCRQMKAIEYEYRKNPGRPPINQNGQDGAKNPNAKLSEKDVLDIFRSKERTGILCRLYGVAPATITDIRGGRSWLALLSKEQTHDR